MQEGPPRDAAEAVVDARLVPRGGEGRERRERPRGEDRRVQRQRGDCFCVQPAVEEVVAGAVCEDQRVEVREGVEVVGDCEEEFGGEGEFWVRLRYGQWCVRAVHIVVMWVVGGWWVGGSWGFVALPGVR